MIKNYFKVAWRHLVRHSFYSSLNILGLAAGIGFAFLVAGYIWSELQVNRTLKNPDNQYLIQSKWKDPNMGIEITTLGPLAKTLKERYPGLIENYYRFDGVGSTVSRGDKYFREGLQVGDTTFFSMFGFPVLHGNPKRAFENPFSVVITAEKALKYFGRTDVVGETLTIENFSGGKHGFLVTVVLKDLPNNSVSRLTAGINNGIFLPVTCLDFFGRNMEKWENQYIVSYIQLKNGVPPEALAGPIAQVLQLNVPEPIKSNLNAYITPLTTFYRESNNGLVKKLLYTLSFVAIFLLLMAVINFINISVSKSSVRIREIGVRKVLGGQKRQLILQFVIESVMLVLLATLLALALYQLARPYFSEILGKQVSSLWHFPLRFIFAPLALIIVLGFLAGIYPAFVLSSLNLVGALKGTIRIKENVILRKSLVGIQFSTAIIVLFSAIVISQQIVYFFTKEIGYNKEFIVSAQLPREWSDQGIRRMETIRNEFMKMSQIENVSLSYEIPNGSNRSSFQAYKWGSDASQAISLQSLSTDEKFAETYQLSLKSGLFFGRPGENYDSTKVVLNESAAKALGWKTYSDAIGQKIRVEGLNNTFTIAGIVQDFHFGSMHEVIPPFIFLHVKNLKEYRYFSFKLRPGNIGNTMEALQQKWQQLLPGSAFEYNFMDEILSKMYETELQLKKASYAATTLTLVIVLLGVFGLVSLNIYKKLKEVGIRKVLGASMTDIILIFLKEFIVAIVLAGLISFPVGYFIMKEWLNNYAYRINITAQPFLMSIILVALITIVLVSFQTLRMATAAPMKSLRTE